MKNNTLKIAIVGSSGYTGGELYRILLHHPGAVVTVVTSEKSAGKPITDIFPHLLGLTDLVCEPLDPASIAKKADLAFLALPHVTAQEAAFQLHKQGVKVVDLSADHRLADPALYETWYEHCHQHPELLKSAVYGLPELHRERIRKASLIANPGCYPTSAILGLAPVVAKKMIDVGTIVVDSKSGVSGAGRSPALAYHYPEANEGFMAYKVGTHRHTPEIEQELSLLADASVTLSFTPHLVPMTRGILSTIYAKLSVPADTGTLHNLFQEFYRNEPFVRLLPLGQFPNVRNVRGSNFCDIGVHADGRTGRAVIVTAIDNLVKGASGQAVQNMNLMMGYEETAGLKFAGLFP
ncbi:MAG: N-acetyl-gamma-glutamyl-phosphate reductase [Nitrospirae bacterium]|nr:N-acetyl-gamma-glutamyl-phosphate reductase [Nitrospirota bacterium]NTW65056.1 N-acetyl-gamma-glutamyl-phosphate reductase [Nitrospirota bacterium]